MSASLAGRRVAIYARYSSANQSEASIEDQVHRCAEFVRKNGGIVHDALIFADHAISGASLARPAFERLIDLVDARPPRVDAIVTEDMSRISRDFADAAQVFRRLQFLNIPLIGVGDGIDTSAPNAKINFTLKSLMSDLYLQDLADKTLRGLEGRARLGYSTGGLPYGYASVAEPDGRGGVIGYRVVINDAQATVVRRIFALYLDGRSLSAIAGILNAEGLSPPRSARRRVQGWVDSAVRAMLHNEAYVGVATFKKREWRKLPGSNKRRYRKRPTSEVIRREYPERRIIDAETWAAVQARLLAVRAKYKSDKMNGTAPGHRTVYPLSGLLCCGVCRSMMVISGGSVAKYYMCAAAKQRRTCPNRLSVREDVARRCILGAICEQLVTPNAIDYLRKRIAGRLGALARDANRELDERRARLDRTEQRIAGLVTFLADGDRSEYVVSALRDLEAQAVAEKREIAAILARAKTPVRLPTADQILERALDLERVLAADPVRAREALRRLLVDGKIVLEPGADGLYVATFTFQPMVLLAEGSAGSAGAPGVGVPLSVRLA